MMPTKLREIPAGPHASGNADGNRFGNDVDLAHDLRYQCSDPI
jgi:hypothetical protein